jgi:hypothetical protein
LRERKAKRETEGVGEGNTTIRKQKMEEVTRDGREDCEVPEHLTYL